MPPSFSGQVHRAARQRHAHAERERLLRLDVHRILEAGRIEILVVGAVVQPDIRSSVSASRVARRKFSGLMAAPRSG